MEIMRRLVQEEEGQGMVEYALIIALISIGSSCSYCQQLEQKLASIFTTN